MSGSSAARSGSRRRGRDEGSICKRESDEPAAGSAQSTSVTTAANISNVLGRASHAIAADVYAKVSEELQQQAAAAMDVALG